MDTTAASRSGSAAGGSSNRGAANGPVECATSTGASVTAPRTVIGNELQHRVAIDEGAVEVLPALRAFVKVAVW
jgi:hypothetical protein